MNYLKRKMKDKKYLKYCNIAQYSKQTRIREKASKIINTQIDDFFPHY